MDGTVYNGAGVCVCVREREGERERLSNGVPPCLALKFPHVIEVFKPRSSSHQCPNSCQFYAEQSCAEIVCAVFLNPKCNDSLNFTFHTTCRKFQHFPLLSVTALCSENRAYLVLVNEGIHLSSAQGQSTLGREKESNELHLHFLSIIYDVWFTESHQPFLLVS